MNGRLIRLADAPAQPWRNGGGSTRELYRWPAQGAPRLRISVADIAQDGPFSAYPGVMRWFAVLEGAGVVLAMNGAEHRQTRADPPLGFDGAAAPNCRLIGGPTRDLNLMLQAMRGSMTVAVERTPWAPEASMCGLFSATAGRCIAAGQAFDMPAGALLWFSAAPTVLVFEATAPGHDASGWWIAATCNEIDA